MVIIDKLVSDRGHLRGNSQATTKMDVYGVKQQKIITNNTSNIVGPKTAMPMITRNKDSSANSVILDHHSHDGGHGQLRTAPGEKQARKCYLNKLQQSINKHMGS